MGSLPSFSNLLGRLNVGVWASLGLYGLFSNNIVEHGPWYLASMDLDCVTVWAWASNHNLTSIWLFCANLYVCIIHANNIMLV